MNTKKAKALRREIGYHPSQPRKYTDVNAFTRKNGVKTIVEVHPSDKRSLYQEMKKEIA